MDLKLYKFGLSYDAKKLKLNIIIANWTIVESINPKLDLNYDLCMLNDT